MSKIKRFFVGLYHAITDDNVTDVAAMMAYYAAFALFPMLVFIVTLTLLVLPADVLHQGLAMVTAAMPRAIGDLMGQQVDRMAKAASSGFAIGGAVLALWSASRGAASLSGALNRMFQKKEHRSWIKRQLIALGLTFAVAILVVIALGLLFLGPTIGHAIIDRFGEGGLFDRAWSIGRWIGAGLIVMFVWALLYKFLPDTDAPFRIFTPGAIFGVLLWLGISYLFSLYVSYHDTYEATYGTLGGAILFLTWLWMSNLSILIGAEINDVLADMRKHADPAAAELARHETPAQHGRDNAPVDKRAQAEASVASDDHHEEDITHLVAHRQPPNARPRERH
jgi:membrane protein